MVSVARKQVFFFHWWIYSTAYSELVTKFIPQSVIKQKMKIELRMEGAVNGHKFVIIGAGNGHPFE